MSCTLEPPIQSCNTGQWTPFFDSCQLTWKSIRVSTIKLNTDCICLEQLASNAQTLKENNARLAANQSAHTIVAI